MKIKILGIKTYRTGTMSSHELTLPDTRLMSRFKECHVGLVPSLDDASSIPFT